MGQAGTRSTARGRQSIDTASGRWQLVWSDEFDGDRIDPAKWDFDIGNGFYDYANHQWIAGWGNQELQYDTRESANATVKDSFLTIRARKEELHGCGYTSARLKTRERDGSALFTTLYGRVEIRAKVPWGSGLWPASGEIDLMEIVGEKPHEVLSSIHFGSPGTEARQLATHVHPLPGGGTVADWHIDAVEWEPGEIRFFVDGVHTNSCAHWWSCSLTRYGHGVIARRASDLNAWPAPFDQPFYLIMYVAVGGNFPGAPDSHTRFPAELAVVYVRVYRKSAGYDAPRPVDFISLHTYPVWEYKHVRDALACTREHYDSVAQRYPDKPVVITEAEWATNSNGRGIEPHNASQQLQANHLVDLVRWTDDAGILCFVFEAFDEPWKGSPDPLEPEKHWGLYTVERQPKPAVNALQPEAATPAASPS